MRVIFHGDDLGLTHSFNRGIFTCFREGLLRSTCLRTNGTGFEAAVEQLPDHPGLGVGIHLNLVEGRSALRPGSPLGDENGTYRLGFVGLHSALRRDAKGFLAQVEADYRQQIEAVLAKGIRPDHLNSHQHSHILPPLFDLVCRLAREYGIPCVRQVREPFHLGAGAGHYLTSLPWIAVNVAKFFILNHFANENQLVAEGYRRQGNQRFVGVLHTGFQTTGAIAAGLRAAAKGLPDDGVIEVLLHPTLADPDRPDTFVAPYLRSYVSSPARRAEVDALCSAELRAAVDDLGLTVTNFAELQHA